MPTPEDIGSIHAHIRTCLVSRFGEAGCAIRVLYGGSVTSSNVGDVLGIAEVGGVLIGGASLAAADFDAVLDRTRTEFAGSRAAA